MSKFLNCFLVLFTTIVFSQNKLEVFFQSCNSEAYLKANTSLMVFLQNKNVKILKIQGFCDSIGSNTYNKNLSIVRVKSILKKCKDENIKISKKVVIEGFGENFKLNSDNELNRKVIVFYKSLATENEVYQDLYKDFGLLKKGDLLKLKNLNFYNNSAQLLKKSESVLDDLIAVLKKYPKLKIEIQGHICCKTKIKPDVVSGARAKYVYEVLISNGIEKKRLEYKGYGVLQPIYSIPEKMKKSKMLIEESKS